MPNLKIEENAYVNPYNSKEACLTINRAEKKQLANGQISDNELVNCAHQLENFCKKNIAFSDAGYIAVGVDLPAGSILPIIVFKREDDQDIVNSDLNKIKSLTKNIIEQFNNAASKSAAPKPILFSAVSSSSSDHHGHQPRTHRK